ncbi:MAG: hypothetical protein ACT4OW_02615 [Nitrososphaerota archaeon]
MSKKHSISLETLIILGILFVFYDAGDLMTTVWLVAKHPGGITGESNPLGILIYTQQGIFGLITAKLMVFIAISLMAIIIEFHYKDVKNVVLVSHFSILGLMALSLIVVTVNVVLIYTLSLQEGSYESTFLLRVYLVILGVTLAGLFLLPKFVPGSLGIVEAVLAIVVILGPLGFSPGMYQFLLNDNIVNFTAYIAINIGIIGLMIYGMNRLYKHILYQKK